MREILLSLRRKLAVARSEESRERVLAHVFTAIDDLDQALLAVPQYEDMQQDLNEKNDRITQLERENRVLLDGIAEAQSIFGGIVNRDEDDDDKPQPTESTTVPAIAERIMRIS